MALQGNTMAEGAHEQITNIPQTLEDTLGAIVGEELLFSNVVFVMKLLLVTMVTAASVECATQHSVFLNQTAETQ